MTATKTHTDGGTYRVLALHATSNGWAVAITEWTTYRNQIRFEVLRVSPDNKALRLATKITEQDARDAANAVWKQDR
jgi:hypothetical protein